MVERLKYRFYTGNCLFGAAKLTKNADTNKIG